jgi:uncharacterized protein YbjT (DUF2867 family)
MRRGYQIVAVARRFTHSQREHFGPSGREIPVARLDVQGLTGLLQESAAHVVVNCLGLLQDRLGERTQDVHDVFVDKLIAALRVVGPPILLVHISIPGSEAEDRTDFSRTKRNADLRIIASGMPYAILRPGFVLAPAAFGGSAMMRSLAALPVELPAFESDRPFASVAVEDIAETVDVLVQRWTPERRNHAVVWDVMHPDRGTVADLVGILRRWIGATSRMRIRMPKILLDLGARAGDLAAFLGWAPPIRSTAIAEMRRGVEGDPQAWLAATGITPHTLESVLWARPATVQEKWFSRLYLLKALVIASLVVFWCASAVIVLTVAYPAAVAILTVHGFPERQAHAMTIAGSVMDFAIGLAIAFRRTSRYGLVAGVAVSAFYMAAAALLTPELWIEPLGALVKTFPAIVLMLVALAITDDR